MPNRIIRESIIDSERVNRLQPEHEVFYRRLLNKVDDFARYDGRLTILRTQLFALQLDAWPEDRVKEAVDACVAEDLVTLYEVDGKPYLELHTFNQQKRAKTSKYPDPPACAQQTHSTCEQTPSTPKSDKTAIVDNGGGSAQHMRSTCASSAHLGVGEGVVEDVGVGEVGASQPDADDRQRTKALDAIGRLMGRSLAFGQLSAVDNFAASLPAEVDIGGKPWSAWRLIEAAASSGVQSSAQPHSVNGAVKYLKAVIERCIGDGLPPGRFEREKAGGGEVILGSTDR
jgi:hypothetical protein